MVTFTTVCSKNQKRGAVQARLRSRVANLFTVFLSVTVIWSTGPEANLYLRPRNSD